jgi:hypothetical protein
MKYITLLIFLFFLSCKNDQLPSDPSLIVNKTHRYDTSVIDIYIDSNNHDTIFRFDIDKNGNIIAKDGQWMVYYDKALTKKFFEGSILNSEEVGNYTRWYPSGQKLWEGFRVGKIDTGYEKAWYPSGQLKSVRYSRNNTVIGNSNEYFETGELKSEMCFVDNEISKIITYNKKHDTINTVFYKTRRIASSNGNYPYSEIICNSKGQLINSYLYVLDSVESKEKDIKVWSYLRTDLDSLKRL